MSRKTDTAVVVCSIAFIVVLGVAAYWDPTIRVLHGFEAIPYAATAVLCRRRNRLGYPLGFASGAFWLWTAGLLTTFVRNGFERLAMLVRTGTVDRLDILIAVPAALATGGLALFSVLGYLQRSEKSTRDALSFLAAFAIVSVFFVAIMAAFAPRYLGMFTPVVQRLGALVH
jgi:hypothetical protein